MGTLPLLLNQSQKVYVYTVSLNETDSPCYRHLYLAMCLCLFIQHRRLWKGSCQSSVQSPLPYSQHVLCHSEQIRNKSIDTQNGEHKEWGTSKNHTESQPSIHLGSVIQLSFLPHLLFLKALLHTHMHAHPHPPKISSSTLNPLTPKCPLSSAFD